MSIPAVASLWAAGDRHAALEALSAVWAQREDHAVTELCEQLSELLVRERVGLLSRELNPDQLRASLIVAAQTGDRVAVHALLPWLTTLARPKGRQRLAFLDPPDPVLLRWLCHWLWRRPELNELAQYLVSQRSPWLRLVHEWWSRDAPHEIDRFARESPHWWRHLGRSSDQRALDPAEVESLAALRAAFEAELPAEQATADGLLAAVYERPDDHACRAILADFLLSQDQHDPRGEFIQLQLQAAAGPVPESATARERELLDLHGLRWLGPLVQDCVLPSVRFERGFLAGLDLRPRASMCAASVGHPIWTTVETVNGGTWVIVNHPVMRSLRVLGCESSCARALLAGPTRARIEALWVEFIDWFAENQRQPDRATVLLLARELFARIDAVPNLRHLGVRDSIAADPESWQWLWQGPRTGLESVRLRIETNEAPQLWRWCEQLRRDRSSVELLLDHGKLRYALLPIDGYQTVRVTHNVPRWRVSPSHDQLLGYIVNGLAPSLSAAGLRRVEIVGAIVDVDRLRHTLQILGLDHPIEFATV